MEMLQAAGLGQWIEIGMLYREAFPKNERKPLWIIRKNQKAGKSDAWYFRENGKFVGLATSVKAENGPVLIDYFAVKGGNRGQGHGGDMLERIKEYYRDRGIFGEIEAVDETADNYEQRKRRLQFYLRHDIVPQNVRADVFGVEMEVMAWGCQMDFEAYHSFYCENIGEFARENIKEIK